MKKKIVTLCLVHQHPKLLLGMKKRGFGAGRWNGFGGKLVEGESVEDATKREVLEECGIRLNDIELHGILTFEYPHKDQIMETHLFKAVDFSGEPLESEEMKPQWFHVDEIPFKEMWKDDVYWMPLFLKDKKFTGRFLFDAEDNILEHDIKLVTELGNAGDDAEG